MIEASQGVPVQNEAWEWANAAQKATHGKEPGKSVFMAYAHNLYRQAMHGKIVDLFSRSDAQNKLLAGMQEKVVEQPEEQAVFSLVQQ